MTFTRGAFVFADDGKLAESEANLVAWQCMIQECQELEDEGPDDDSERAHLIVQVMIDWGALTDKPK